MQQKVAMCKEPQCCSSSRLLPHLKQKDLILILFLNILEGIVLCRTHLFFAVHILPDVINNALHYSNTLGSFIDPHYVQEFFPLHCFVLVNPLYHAQNMRSPLFIHYHSFFNTVCIAIPLNK